MFRFVVTGGGTGGHVYPALAIARGLQEKYRGSKILYVGKEGGPEAELAPAAGLDFVPLRVRGLVRRLTPENLLALSRAGLAFWQAARIIARFRPRAVIGTGGYVCGPVMLAAVCLRVPTLLHEQNALPGVTTRVLARFVRRVAVTFPESVRYLPRRARVKLTGLPVRSEFLQAERNRSRQALAVPEGAFLVLSFGGSQGARSINAAMREVIARLGARDDVRFLHVTGPAQYDEFLRGFTLPENGNTTVKPYLHEMPLALSAADLVVCRAGASTLAEVTATGVPAILIPYPYATGNHQVFNARALQEKGAAVVIEDAVLNGELLANQIERLLAEPARLRQMAAASRELGRPRALEEILACVEELVAG
ncbi:MAG: undecaprenyldiphospho-muramoylpentapeptide beta-N-acetylglucosaminyltransferase [Desulfotomaculales bacterium]